MYWKQDKLITLWKEFLNWYILGGNGIIQLREEFTLYNRFETSAVWFETMEKQLLLNNSSVVERKTNCVFLSLLCGSFECTLATPVFASWRGKKKIPDAFVRMHHTSQKVWLKPILTLWHHQIKSTAKDKALVLHLTAMALKKALAPPHIFCVTSK